MTITGNPPLSPLLWRNEDCNKPGEQQIIFFTHTISHIDHPLPLLHFPAPLPPLTPPFFSSSHCIPVMTNVKQSVRRVFCLFGNQELAKSTVRWDKTAAEASRWSISIRYFCESNRNVWRCCHKLTGSCCLCAPEGNGAFSAPLSPPSLLLFLNLFLCLVVITFIVVKNLSMAVFCGFWQRGSALYSELKLEELRFCVTWRLVIFQKRWGVCQSQPWCVLIISVPLGEALTVRVRVPSPGQYQYARISYTLMSDTATS